MHHAALALLFKKGPDMSLIKEICTVAPVIPVITIEDARDAAPLACALVKGGLPGLEVTLRTEAAFDAIAEMAQVEGAYAGVGTVLNADHVVAAKAAGAVFAVSPGATDAVLNAAQDHDLPLLPGAVTASEAMALLEKGYEFQKFFPAETSGGAPALKALSGPLPQITFCPTGGVSPQNAPDYLSLPNVVCVGGSWIASPDLIAAKDWDEITSRARQAAALGR